MIEEKIERRPIPGYEDSYEAGSDGSIWSLERTVDHPKGPMQLKERRLSAIKEGKGYFRAHLSLDGKQKKYRIHRLVGSAFGVIDIDDRNQQIDHINHNKADNRLINLRAATISENKQWGGKRLQSNNNSGFRGVSWDKQRRKWQSTIQIKGDSKRLGRFNCRFEAARAYDAAAKEHFGEFANLNFPEEDAA